MDNSTQNPETAVMEIHIYCQRLVNWLDALQKEWDLLDNLSEFERRLGVKRGTIRNIKSGSLPRLDKIAQIVSATEIGWEKFGKIIDLNPDSPEQNQVPEKMDEQQDKEETMQQILTTLLEVRKDIKTVKKAKINPPVLETSESKLTEMIAECIANKTEEELKAQIEFLRFKDMNWETFQAIVRGTRPIKDPKEVEQIKIIIDPIIDPENLGKYALTEWLYNFFILNQNLEKGNA